MLNLKDLQLLFKDKLSEEFVKEINMIYDHETMVKVMGYALLSLSDDHKNIDDKILELIENI